jgi:hypothetical protein
MQGKKDGLPRKLRLLAMTEWEWRLAMTEGGVRGLKSGGFFRDGRKGQLHVRE